MDLWLACTARDPFARPFAADVQEVLTKLVAVPRSAAPAPLARRSTPSAPLRASGDSPGSARHGTPGAAHATHKQAARESTSGDQALAEQATEGLPHPEPAAGHASGSQVAHSQPHDSAASQRSAEPRNAKQLELKQLSVKQL